MGVLAIEEEFSYQNSKAVCLFQWSNYEAATAGWHRRRDAEGGSCETCKNILQAISFWL
jgi:hypothetical protein